MKYIKIAFRNIIREKKRSFLPALAIGIGLFIVTLVSMASLGAVDSLTKTITKLMDGHLVINSQEKLESGKTVYLMKNKDEINKIVEESGIPVTKINRRSSVYLELIFGDNSTSTEINGMNWDAEEEVKKGLDFVEGDISAIEDRQSIIITDSLAEKLGVELGEYVIGKLNTVTGQLNVGDFKIGGIIKGEGFFSGMTTYGNIGYLNSLIGLEEDDYQAIIITTDDIDKAEEYSNLLRSKIGEKFQVKDAKDSQVQMNFDMNMAFKNKDDDWSGLRYNVHSISDMAGVTSQLVGFVDAVSIAVLGILFIVIIVGIANTFRMIMYDRVQEIGTLRAMGMQRSGIRKLFLSEGAILALNGALGGVVIAALAAFIISFIDLGSDHALSMFLLNGKLQFIPDFGKILGYVIGVSVLTVLVVLFPASKAAKLDPAKAIASMY